MFACETLWRESCIEEWCIAGMSLPGLSPFVSIGTGANALPTKSNAGTPASMWVFIMTAWAFLEVSQLNKPAISHLDTSLLRCIQAKMSLGFKGQASSIKVCLFKGSGTWDLFCICVLFWNYQFCKYVTCIENQFKSLFAMYVCTLHTIHIPKCKYIYIYNIIKQKHHCF